MGKQTKRKFTILQTFCFVILLTATVSTGQTEYQDTEWESSYKSHLLTIFNDSSRLNNASLNNDMLNTSAYATALNIDCQNALAASKSFAVSPSLQPKKDEYEAGLSDLSQGSYYYAKEVTESQKGESKQASEDINTGVFYLNSAFDHFKNVYKL